MPDYDPRVVALYDVDNPAGPDHDFVRAGADEVGARSIVDLGCGTGLLTVTLWRPGRTVVGIDPSRAMLDYAATREGAEHVSWVHGDSAAIGDAQADLVIMTGNVAQHILGESWQRTLREIYGGLRPGGLLVFECRNPAARAWEAWTKEKTYTTRDTPDGGLTEWLEVTTVSDAGDVSFTAENVFASGERLTYHETLAFRSHERVADDLRAAGLTVTATWGGWDREPMRPASAIMVFEAQRPE